MPPKTLKTLATQSCIQNVKYMYDVGDAPFELVRPFLSKIRVPQQLKAIEEASPQIVGQNEEIWRSFIIRDIPKGGEWLQDRDRRLKEWEEEAEREEIAIEPRKPTNWFKVYQKLRNQAEEAAASHTARLAAALNQKAAEKASNEITLDATLISKLPRRKDEFAVAAPKPTLKNMSILQKARRDAQDASHGRKCVQSPVGMIEQSPVRTVLAKKPRLVPASNKATSAQPTPTTSAAPSVLPKPPSAKEEAMQRRERALAQAKINKGMVLVESSPVPPKRNATGPSPLVPNKRPRR